MIQQELTTDQLIAGTDIVTLFGEVTELKKQGKEYVCCCPIHQEKTPSCRVHPDKQLFHCYGCGAGGSVADFLVSYHNVSLHEAFNMLRNRLTGITDFKVPEVRLTEKGQTAVTMKHACEIETPYFFAEYGLVAAIHDVYKGQAFVLLSDGKKTVDHLLESELRRYKRVEPGFCVLGEYHQNAIVCTDYIDSLYLRNYVDAHTMVVFAGHPQHLQFTIDAMKRKGCKNIIATTPNIWDHIKFAETCSEKSIMPQDVGYWCERHRRQEINL